MQFVYFKLVLNLRNLEPKISVSEFERDLQLFMFGPNQQMQRQQMFPGPFHKSYGSFLQNMSIAVILGLPYTRLRLEII